MICRIHDEAFNNPWEDDAPIQHVQSSVHDLTIGELMGENFGVWIGKNKKFGYVIELENESGLVSTDKCIHPYAMESMADFCRQFLYFYDRIEAVNE